MELISRKVCQGIQLDSGGNTVEMNINGERIKTLRSKKAWSQEQLATAAGLSLRTVQRIEKNGVASNESAKALAAVFDTHIEALAERTISAPRAHRFPVQASLGFVGGSLLGLLLFFAGTASAVDYTVQSFLNSKAVESRQVSDTAVVPLVDGLSQERARVRITASETENAQVRFNVQIYRCDRAGCKEVELVGLETPYGKPARVAWPLENGDVIAYEMTPSK
jgi:transcriptional regulator with XRE-family HTH domain